VDWIILTGAKKVHSLIDKVYKRKNLEMAWEKVKANRGSGGVDGQSLEAFEAQLDQQLERLQRELKEDTYQPLPVRQHPIPKRDKPGEYRMLGIPAIYDRVCQQALLNRLEPIFEPIFDDASFGYRRGRSPKDALRKIWKEIQSGSEWIVDADLRDFFGSVDQEKLLTLVSQRVADGRVLSLIKAMLKAGSYGQGQLFPSERGTPQGGVVSPTLSNILLTPFDREMRLRGYQLTRFADDWVITCRSAAEARAAVEAAGRILKQLGVELHPQKTRIVHVREGFEFLGYKIKRGQKKLHLPASKIRSQARQGALYAYPKEKSIGRFMDQVRQRTRRGIPLKTAELIVALNPLLRGWGELQACPRPQALPTSRRLDPAAHLVASVPALKECRLETAACDQALRRVRACSVDRFNSFSCISASLNLRESCMRENCTCSLRGGRRPARKRASSDPTVQKPASGRLLPISLPVL
jgi:RNA-directed DNA polymerase